MSIQVFEINDCEWWAGEGEPAAILAAYLAATGCTPEEATGDPADYPTPLTEAQLDTLKFVLDEQGDRLATPKSFREHLAEMVARGTVFPCFFATTEW